MKSLSIFTLFVFLLSTSFTGAPKSVNTDGINFLDISSNAAIQKAQKENKLVFVNVYAVWCGACMLLKEKTFTSKNVSDAVNSHFISIDINTEKGEGAEFTKKYEVTAHPLILILDGNGKVKKRILGYKTDTQLLNELKEFL